MHKSTPLILHIETTTAVCSVAVSHKNVLLTLVEDPGSYNHSSRLTIQIRDCVRQAGFSMKDLDAVSLSSGPGSYTGLRVGAATAKAICYAMNIPLISVSTLESLALATVQSCLKDALFIPMIDARRMEVYTALFDADGNRMLSDQALVLHDSVFRTLFEAGERLVLSGDGSIKARDLFTSGNVDILDIRCSAQHLVIPAWRAYLGSQFEDIAYYTPNYLKAPNITKSSKTLV